MILTQPRFTLLPSTSLFRSHLGGEAGAREHRRGDAGQGLGDDLAHQQSTAGLDALGADHQRRAGFQTWRQVEAQPAGVLGRGDQQQDIGAGRLGQLGGSADVGVEGDAGEVDEIGSASCGERV